MESTHGFLRNASALVVVAVCGAKQLWTGGKGKVPVDRDWLVGKRPAKAPCASGGLPASSRNSPPASSRNRKAARSVPPMKRKRCVAETKSAVGEEDTSSVVAVLLGLKAEHGKGGSRASSRTSPNSNSAAPSFAHRPIHETCASSSATSSLAPQRQAARRAANRCCWC